MSGTDLGTGTNWSTDVVPSASVPDTGLFDGTVGGALSLVYSNTAFAGAIGNVGVNWSLAGTQTSSVSFDSGTNTASLRMDDVTVASGAGAFTFGNSANTFNITLGGVGGQTHAWTNNSANAVTVNSDVVFGLGGGGTHTLTLAGSGNYSFNNSIVSSLTINHTGAGAATFSGAIGNNVITVGPASGTVAVLNTSGNVTRSAGTATNIGTVAGGVGVLNVSAGTWSGGSSAISAGTAGHGVINVSGGTITPGQFLVAGITTSGASGIWNISAGTVQTTGNNGGTLGATAGTTGVLNVTGTGVYNSTNNTANGVSGIFVGESGTGILNVAGSGTVSLGGVSTSAGLDIGRNNVASSVGIVNLGAVGTGGGLITTNRVRKAGAAATGTFNFHGGTLQAKTGVANGTFMTGLTNAYVYGENGTIDNNAQAITIGQNLLAPTGNGVSSITLGGATTGFTPGATPLVSITGGGGSGATAVASVDGSGNLTVTLTNPGVGYTSAPSVSFAGTGGLVPTATTAIAANTSGGLSFIGSSTTTLSGTSNYTGTSTINAGKLSVTGSLAGPVSVATGTLDGTGSVGAATVADLGTNVITNGAGLANALTLSSLTFNGDAIANVRTNGSAGLVVTNALTTTPANGTVTLNPTHIGNWSTGTNNLISFGTSSFALTDFTLGTVTGGLSSRQAIGALVLNGNNIALQVNGDNPKWTGLDSSDWVVGPTGANANWKLAVAATPTDYIEGDAVVFDDSAAGTTTVNINNGGGFNVSPLSTVFNNSTKNYTLTGIGSILTGTLTKTGTGTLTINTGNNFTGGTTFDGGTIKLGSLAGLGNGVLTIAPGTAKALDNLSGVSGPLSSVTAIALNDDITFLGTQSMSLGSGLVTLGGGTRTITVNSTTLTASRLSSAVGGLNVSGAGILALNSGIASSISGTLNVDAGATFQFNSGPDAETTNDFFAAGLSGLGTVQNGGGVERWMFVNTPANASFAGVLQNGAAGALGFVKQGPATQTLAGTNTYTGPTTLSADGGTLSVTGSISNTSLVTFGGVATSAVLQVNSAATNPVGTGTISLSTFGNTTTDRIELSGGATLPNPILMPLRNNSAVNIQSTSGNNTLAGTISVSSGGSQGRIQSDAGLLTLSGATAITSAATGNRVVTLQGAGNGLVSGAITNGAATTVGIIKEGTGTWELSGVNTFTGTTTINLGTLKVSGSLVSNTTVNAGGVLGGAGSIAGSVTLIGGTLAPGSSPETITIGNSLSMDSASILSYELNGTDLTVGGGINDLTTGVTNLTLDGTLNVSETVASSFLSANLGDTWRLINYTGSLTNNTLDLGTLPVLGGGLTYAIDTATANQVNLTIVPEPASLTLIGLGAAAMLRRRRR